MPDPNIIDVDNEYLPESHLETKRQGPVPVERYAPTIMPSTTLQYDDSDDESYYSYESEDEENFDLKDYAPEDEDEEPDDTTGPGTNHRSDQSTEGNQADNDKGTHEEPDTVPRSEQQEQHLFDGIDDAIAEIGATDIRTEIKELADETPEQEDSMEDNINFGI